MWSLIFTPEKKLDKYSPQKINHPWNIFTTERYLNIWKNNWYWTTILSHRTLFELFRTLKAWTDGLGGCSQHIATTSRASLQRDANNAVSGKRQRFQDGFVQMLFYYETFSEALLTFTIPTIFQSSVRMFVHKCFAGMRLGLVWNLAASLEERIAVKYSWSIGGNCAK